MAMVIICSDDQLTMTMTLMTLVMVIMTMVTMVMAMVIRANDYDHDVHHGQHLFRKKPLMETHQDPTCKDDSCSHLRDLPPEKNHDNCDQHDNCEHRDNHDRE